MTPTLILTAFIAGAALSGMAVLRCIGPMARARAKQDALAEHYSRLEAEAQSFQREGMLQ